jgi:hypothetical protein
MAIAGERFAPINSHSPRGNDPPAAMAGSVLPLLMLRRRPIIASAPILVCGTGRGNGSQGTRTPVAENTWSVGGGSRTLFTHGYPCRYYRGSRTLPIGNAKRSWLPSVLP